MKPFHPLSEHLARRQELVGFKRGGDRRSDEFQSGTVPVRKTTNEIAKDIGLTEASAQKRMQAARNITPEVKDTIRNTEIANSTTFIRSNTAINSRN